jgi:DNA-binding beta-propeller fold protein YncE
MPVRYHDRNRRVLAAFLVLVAVGCWLTVLGGVDARAATTYNWSSGSEFALGNPSGPSYPPPGEMWRPTKLAVDDATGNVLVVDSDQNNVLLYGWGGPYQWTTFGGGELSAPYGIAIDQGSQAVYVSDAGNNRIVRYTTDGQLVPTYTLDPTYTSPAQGSGTGQVGSFESPLAIDPTNGDLLVADTGNNRVSRYTSSGAFVASFTGADTVGGAFQSLLDLTVDATGTIYVIADNSADDLLGSMEGTSRVERFSPTGVSQGRLGAGALDKARSITSDSLSGNVAIASQGEFFGLSTLHIYHGDVPLTDLTYPNQTNNAAAVGLAIDGGSSGTSGRLYTLQASHGLCGSGYCTYGTRSVQVYDPIPLPDLVLDAPSAVGGKTAHLSGTVNPLGTPTSYQFELSTDGGQNWVPVANRDAGSGNVAAPVSEDPVLVPNSDYQVRLRGTNVNGTMATFPRSFHTDVAAPDVTTDPATDRTTTGATLRGSVAPYGLQTTYHFEYGPTTAYGSRAPVSTERPAGDGFTARHVQLGLTGLQPGLTYHYRLVARNSVGETAGVDRTFVTVAGADPARVYELASPADKDGANVHTNYSVRSSLNGDRVAYFATTPIAGLAKGAPAFTRYMAARGNAGWSSVGVDPPPLRVNYFPNAQNTLGVSDDGKKAVVISAAKLADGAVAGDSNTYLADLEKGTYTTIATVPGTEQIIQNEHPFNSGEFIGATPDFSHVLISGENWSLLPGAPTHAAYDFSGGKLRLVSTADDGTPLDITAGGNSNNHDNHLISDDGTRIVISGGIHPVYMRLNGTTTLTVSESQRTADPPGTVQNATFWGASSDGRFVIIRSKDLTDDSPPGEEAVYRYDVDARHLTLLTPADVNTAPFQVSSDGMTVYFISSQVLAPGAIFTEGNLYVWRAGQTRLIATLHDALDHAITPSYRASPSGRYFIFRAYGKLTPYDNSSKACTDVPGGDPVGALACAEIYRYDADTGAMTCPSCRRDGGHPTGNARIAVKVAEQDTGGPYFPRAILDDGRVFFDTPDPLAAGDTNSKRDVYVFDGDEAHLISSGRGGASGLGDVSPDGRDVFFTTQDQLVSQDKDTLTDLYDARIGGRILPASPDLTCSGEDCRGSTPGAGAPEPVSSQTVRGAERRPAAPAKAKLTITAAKFRGALLDLSVGVSGAGRIRASGKTLVAATRTTSKSGRYHVHVRLTKKQRALLRAGRTVRAAITVSFTPVYGQRATMHITRTAGR